ncbi:hypothetical protein GDO86_008474 [Hymenochirus boettgeri]|uniref:H15 domain-containing protein n=1 Tax=Hymenochirus boettgeri TaxID=247094 RepID=A0A8T2J580_9PIPI|nr:hypothetical protein GDO86_008474 [Hymenochirus boettgeri]
MEQKKASSSSGKRKEEEPAGQYSQLVVDTSAVWARENGSSLAKIYSEAKKVSWFDQQNGRTYLKYSIRALVQNDTLSQVKASGPTAHSGSTRKAGGGPAGEKAPPAAAAKTSGRKTREGGAEYAASGGSSPRKSPKKEGREENPREPAREPHPESEKGEESERKGPNPGSPKCPRSKKA